MSDAASYGSGGRFHHPGWLRCAKLFVCATAVAVSGCAVGPDFLKPVAPDVAITSKRLPALASAAGERQRFVASLDIPGRWWQLFRSRRLNDLVERAINDNNDLQAAEAALRVARYNADAERSAFFPLVTGNYTRTRQKFAPAEDLSSPTNSGNNLFTVHTGQVSVSYMPDVFGGVSRQVENLDALTENQKFQYEAVFLTMSSNIALAVVQEASLREQIEATRGIVAIQRDLLSTLRRQLAAGDISELDVAPQEAALAQAEQSLPGLEKQLSIQRNLLTALTGHFPGEGLSETFDFKHLQLPRDLPTALPSQLIEQRPDIRAAAANLHAASALIGVAVAARLPQITLSGTVGRTGSRFSDLFNASPQFLFWSTVGSASQVLFDARMLERKQKAAEAGFDQAAAQYRSTVIAAFQNVADSLQALDYDARALAAAVSAERAAQKTLSLVQAQLRRGQVGLFQVLNAQQTLLQARLNLAQARASRYADTIALFQALGGGWWNRPDATPDERDGKRAATDHADVASH